MTLPVSVEEVMDYFDGSYAGKEDEVEKALISETSAQSRVCRVDDPIQDDLREALCRRVARNLSLRKVPIMARRGDAEMGNPIQSYYSDPEIKRLESPHLKLVMG